MPTLGAPLFGPFDPSTARPGGPAAPGAPGAPGAPADPFGTTEAELRELLDESEELVCATDAEGRIVYVNAAWQATMGYSAAEAAAIRPVDLVAPEHRGPYLEVARRLVSGERVRDFEAVLLPKGGGRVICRGRARPRMEMGPDGPRCLGTRAVYRNLTAERKAEAMRGRLAATVEATVDAVVMTAGDGQLVYMNRAARRLLGLPDDAPLDALTFARLWDESDATRLGVDAVAAARERGVWEGEGTISGAHGRPVAASVVFIAHPSTIPERAPYFVSVVLRDLTERRRVEAEREAERNFLSAVLDSLSEGVVACDAEGRLTLVNRASREAYGAVLDGEGSGAPWAAHLDLRHPDGSPVAPDERPLGRAMRGEVVNGAELVLASPGRPPVVLQANARQVVDRAGRVLGAVATGRDVTAETQAQAEVALLQRVTHAIAAAHSVEKALLVALEVMCRETGWIYGEAWLPLPNAGNARRAILSRGPAWYRPGDPALISFAHASAAHHFPAGTGLPGRVLEARQPVWVHDVLADRNFLRGEAARAAGLRAAAGVPVLAGDAVVAVLTFHSTAAQDADERTVALLAAVAAQIGAVVLRKQAEAALAEERQFLRAVLDNLSDGVVACDASGQLTLFNRATRELHGLPAAPLPPEAWAEHYDLFMADGRTPMRRDDVPLFRAFRGEVVRDAEIVVAPRHGGQRRTLLASGVSFRDSAGRPNGAVIAMHDVTERRRAEQLKNQLIGTASHELRTPLTAIKGALTMLRHFGTDERSKALLDLAGRNTERLVRLVNDLLDVERLESGAATLDLGAVALAPLFAGACELLDPVATAAGVRLEAACPPVDAWGDAHRLAQVLTNLIGNAVKFSPRDSTITIGAEVFGDSVRVTVRDQGRGIPADKLDSVFERFEQVEALDAKDKGGAGLGLAICRAIVEQHGGRIWAESAGAGCGSAFHFTVPTAERGLAELRTPA